MDRRQGVVVVSVALASKVHPQPAPVLNKECPGFLIVAGHLRIGEVDHWCLRWPGYVLRFISSAHGRRGCNAGSAIVTSSRPAPRLEFKWKPTRLVPARVADTGLAND